MLCSLQYSPQETPVSCCVTWGRGVSYKSLTQPTHSFFNTVLLLYCATALCYHAIANLVYQSREVVALDASLNETAQSTMSHVTWLLCYTGYLTNACDMTHVTCIGEIASVA